MDLISYGKKLKSASKTLKTLNTNDKNYALECIKVALNNNRENIINANKIDIENARKKGMKESLIDRLSLDFKRLDAIIDSIDVVIKLRDPVSVCVSGRTMENGMQILEKTVPLGVLSIIYESRPNVTVDATVLALKSGNAILLRGSSSAINSNIALVSAIKEGLSESEVPETSVMLVDDLDREIVGQILTLNEYIDLVIPRGGADLINRVVKNATVPTIETGVGNCHLFIDENADLEMALDILENGKVQRPSVCNSLETLLVHKNIANEFLKKAFDRIGGKVEFFGCDETSKYIKCEKATETHYETEFLDYIIAVKVVENIDEAIEHIDKFTSGHSECIVTNDLKNADKFTLNIDSACVYVNVSTRFTDGGEFGFGAEMGISTQKMHVRGPVGLEHLVSTKYIITGNGQVRG